MPWVVLRAGASLAARTLLDAIDQNRRARRAALAQEYAKRFESFNASFPVRVANTVRRSFGMAPWRLPHEPIDVAVLLDDGWHARSDWMAATLADERERRLLLGVLAACRATSSGLVRLSQEQYALLSPHYDATTRSAGAVPLAIGS